VEAAAAELKVRESQLEALSAKLKAKAISDEKKLLRCADGLGVVKPLFMNHAA
jgi:hypothetical protein